MLEVALFISIGLLIDSNSSYWILVIGYTLVRILEAVKKAGEENGKHSG